ncbi:MAG: hypothetical protein K0R73_920 [Candidatus Midichloriaceae bacterium]|jgi:hypothetical protein|nr:hypothetical protein [Candidatus Midichloriaceae bacterium]
MRYVPNNIEDISIMGYIKTIINDGLNNSHENIKNVAILVVFQIIIPGTIKLFCWAVAAVESYFNYNDSSKDITSSNANQQNAQVTELVSQESEPINNEIV